MNLNIVASWKDLLTIIFVANSAYIVLIKLFTNYS